MAKAAIMGFGTVGSGVYEIIRDSNFTELLGEEMNVKVKLQYAIDKDAKQITIKKDQESLEKVAKASDGQYDADTLETALSSVITTFDYSVDGEELTLTEREYGEQMLFTKE